MNFATNVVKYILCFFNLIFLLCGLALVVIGGVFLGTDLIKNIPQLDGVEVSLVAAYIFVAVGSVTFIVAALGCCGAIRDNSCLLLTFATILSIIFVLELSAGILAFILRDRVDELATDALERSMDKYGSTGDVTKFWDVVQTSLKCCGWNTASDWYDKVTHKIPLTCCENEDETCHPTSAYETGCRVAFQRWFHTYLYYIAGFGIAIAMIHILGIVFACCLASSVRKSSVYV